MMKIFRSPAAHLAAALTLFGAGLCAMLPAEAQARSFDYDVLSNHLRDWTTYKVTEFDFQFMTACNKDNCFGTNPDSPYGVPVYSETAEGLLTYRRLGSKDALVMIMVTPPEHRYFSMTPYIFSRKYGGGVTPDPFPVYESLSDSVNNRTIKTQPAKDITAAPPFRQVAVFIQGSDQKTVQDIETRLAGKLFPKASVNRMIVPHPADTPNLRYTDTYTPSTDADTYSMLFRIAYPTVDADQDIYVNDPPVRLFHVTPKSVRAFVPLATPARRVPREAPREVDDTALMQALAALEAKMLARYAGTHTIALSPVVALWGTSGSFPCTTTPYACNGDAPDTVYSKDLPDYAPLHREDRFVIVGVNHVETDNAIYVSHGVNRVAQNKGIIAASDAWFKSKDSACVVMGAECTAIHKKLYAVAFAYDCGTDPLCIPIPEGDTDHDGIEDGLPFGEELKISGRYYLEEQRNTRPGLKLIARPRVHVLQRNP